MIAIVETLNARSAQWESAVFHVGWQAAVLVALVVVSVILVRVELDRFRAPASALWDRVSVGDSESEVRETLGEPYREFSGDSSPEDYYVRGYGRKERAITGKVLVYLSADMLLYVWIDEEGIVEDIFRGVS